MPNAKWPFHFALACFSLMLPLVVEAKDHLGVVADTSVEASTNQVRIHLNNLSGRTVYAYRIVLIATFSDGSSDRRMIGQEFLPTAILMQEDPSIEIPENQRPLGSGMERILVQSFKAQTKTLTSADAKVTVVIYEDRTAESVDPEGLALLVQRRQAMSRALRKVSDVINDALRNSKETDPAGAAIRELRQLASSRPQQEIQHWLPGSVLEAAISELEHLSKQGVPRADMSLLVNRRNRRATIWEEQSVLEVH